MATIVTHRKVRIVALAAHEPIAAHCGAGDIAIVSAPDGCWVHFVGADGALDSYDEPYANYQEALWAAKAAAEYGLD